MQCHQLMAVFHLAQSIFKLLLGMEFLELSMKKEKWKIRIALGKTA